MTGNPTMSPGVTFERVYHELKRRLADGVFRPGQPIEPAAISADLAASITPIRDALHRLVGERLVEAPSHNGFLAPRLTEAELRDLYLWNGRLLGLAVRQIRPDPRHAAGLASADPEIGAATADVFFRIAKETGSAEHARAIAQLNDRLAPYRRVEERVLEGLAREPDNIRILLRADDRTHLLRALAGYHQRRARAAPEVLAAAIEPN